MLCLVHFFFDWQAFWAMCLSFCVLKTKPSSHLLQKYNSILLCVRRWELKLRWSFELYSQSGHWIAVAVCTLPCLDRSDLFLNSFPQPGNAHKCFARRWCWIKWVFNSLLKLKLSQQELHLNFFSLWEYSCLLSEIGLLKARLHTLQYIIPCFSRWWAVKARALSLLWGHIRQMYFLFVYFLCRVWLLVVKVPFFLEGTVSVLFEDRVANDYFHWWGGRKMYRR